MQCARSKRSRRKIPYQTRQIVAAYGADKLRPTDMLFLNSGSYVLMYVVFEGTRLCGSPGKLLLGRHVTNLDGEPIGLSRAAVRTVLRFVPSFFFH
ncbi:MAG: RDD family protein, partial [Burkholderiales bacterium]